MFPCQVGCRSQGTDTQTTTVFLSVTAVWIEKSFQYTEAEQKQQSHSIQGKREPQSPRCHDFDTWFSFHSGKKLKPFNNSHENFRRDKRELWTCWVGKFSKLEQQHWENLIRVWLHVFVFDAEDSVSRSSFKLNKSHYSYKQSDQQNLFSSTF